MSVISAFFPGSDLLADLCGRYLSTAAHFNLICGALAAVVDPMLWMFLAGVLLVFGAELHRPAGTHRTVQTAG